MGWELSSVTDEKLVLVNHEEQHAHEIPWAAIASWGELLGISDNTEVLAYLQAVAVGDAPEPDWETLYAALQAPLAEQARNALNGMPQPLTMAILETAETRTQTQARNLMAPMSVEPVGPIVEAVQAHAHTIEEARRDFLTQLTPGA